MLTPLLLSLAQAAPLPVVEVGDVLFHESTSSQAVHIKAATGSRYTHVAIVVQAGDSPVVLEAVQPVKLTALSTWIDRGVHDHYAWRRPTRPLSQEEKSRVATMGMRWVGRDYDSDFSWTDDRLYCSELVYKVLRDAVGIEVGRLRKVSDFDVDDPILRSALEARGIGLDLEVLSPADMLADGDLVDPTNNESPA